MDWNKVKAALKARGVPIPADDSQLLGVALMNLGLLDEATATWVREQRVTPGEYRPKDDGLPKYGDDPYAPKTGKLDDMPAFDPKADIKLTPEQQQMVDLYKSGATKMPDGRPIYGWLPTNPPKPILEPFDTGGTPPPAGSENVDPAKVKDAADAIQSNSLKRGPYKITIPGLAADSSTGPAKPAPAPSGPPAPPPSVVPPHPKGIIGRNPLTPEEFKALPIERQQDLLRTDYMPGQAYDPYSDPQRGTFDASGAWVPFDYSGYAGLLKEYGRQTNYADKYGQQVSDTFSQQFMNSLEDATGDEADFVRANLKNYLTDPGNAAYSLPNHGKGSGLNDPVSVLQAVFQRNKGKGSDPDQIAAKELGASRVARKARRFGTDIPEMAEGTVGLEAIVPLLEKILAAVGGEGMPEMGVAEEDDMPSFEGECESPKKGMALVISPEEEEDDGLPRFADGTVRAPGDDMPVFKPPKVSQPPAATWLKQPPVSRGSQPATSQPPVTVNVNAAPQESPAPRSQYNPGPITVPGTEPGIFVNQNIPPHWPTSSQPANSFPAEWKVLTPAFNGTEDPAQVAAYHAWKATQNPSPAPAPDTTPDPAPNPTPDPTPEENGDGNGREPTMEDVVAIKSATEASAIKAILTNIFGDLGFEWDDAALVREQRALAQFLMQLMAGQIPLDSVKELIRGRVGASEVDDAPAPEEDNGGDQYDPPPSTDPAQDQPPAEDTTPANFTATDIAYLNQLSQSQIPSWRALARSYLGSKGVPMDGVSDEMLGANIDKAYGLIRESDGKAPVGDISKVLKGETLPPSGTEDAPASSASAAASSATANSSAAPSNTTTVPSNTVQLGNGFVLDTVRNVIIDTATGKEYSAGGTTGGTDAPTQIVYGTEAWKNNPTLMYINQLLGSAGFDKLGGMPSYDPFYKTKLAASNAMNYGDMLKVLQDPTSAAIADAIFKRHNRSLAGDTIRAGQFAPLGDARYPGEIRTA